MKVKSKLILFAARLLQALLLLSMPTSAYASSNADQEIGVPQAMEVPAKGCFGVVLSPDGDRFYTAREGLLTQYRINPFEKISLVKLAREQIKDRPEEPHCRIFVTGDESQLIIAFYNRVILMDARSGALLNKIEINLSPFQSAVLNGDDLVSIETYTDASEGYYSLVVRDVKSLKQKRKITDLGRHYGFRPDTGAPRAVKVQNRIYLILHKKVLVLNSKTYAPELFVQSNAIVVDGPFLSADYQTVSFPQGTKVVDYLAGKQALYEGVKEDDVLAFDQKTRISELRKRPTVKSPQPWFRIPIINVGEVSLSKEEIVASPPRGDSYFSMLNVQSRMARQFFLYENGEAIMLAPADGNFQLTAGARKYLMMKNHSGNIVPINDATYTKYHVMGSMPL